MKTIHRLASAALFGSLAVACAAAPAEEEQGDETALASQESALQIGSPGVIQEPGIIVGGGLSSGGLSGGASSGGTYDLKPCTDNDRTVCQACQDGCYAGICATPQGDDRAPGGCVGSFCPTKCNVCVLSCSSVRACVRCFGR